jgi:methylthioribulose-1-phosphate dehydratase
MEARDRRGAAQQLCRIITGFYRRGWCLATSGNFSARTQNDPFRLLITRSGLDKGLVGPDDWIVVDGDGRPADGETGKPSAETFLHAAVAKQMEAASVMHTHSIPATLVSEHFRTGGGVTIRGYEILKGLRGVTTHEQEIFLPIVDNAQDMQVLYERVQPRLATRPRPHGFLIAGHGLYTWGDSIEEAKRHVETLEFLLDCVARRTRFAPFE